MDDTYYLFDATHHLNLAASGGAISVETLGAGRAAMRLQKGIDGTTLVDANPRWLLVPAAKQTLAEQILTSIAAAKATDVNAFAGKLDLAVEPRLDAVSGTRWYLFSEAVPCLEYAHLEGEPAPQVTSRVGFDTLGVEIRVTLDFGRAAIDYRGAYCNPGA